MPPPGASRFKRKVMPIIHELVQAGAAVIGSPPSKSPSLVDYPNCDQEVKELADELWSRDQAASALAERTVDLIELADRLAGLGADPDQDIAGAGH